MSAAAQMWAAKVDVGTPGAAKVLRYLAEQADDRHRCELRQDEVAAGAGVGERSVRRHLDALVKAGLVTRQARSRGEGRGRAPDLLALVVPSDFAQGRCLDLPATNRPLTGHQPAKLGLARRGLTAFSDPSQSQNLPPLGSPPKPLGAGRFQPRQVPLDTLPGPMVCDDWEAARQHPECRRVAWLVLDHADQRAAHPLSGTERSRLHPHVVEWLQAGWAPEAIADAAAHALAKTEPSVGFELRKRARPMRNSVGADGVEVARAWISGGTA